MSFRTARRNMVDGQLVPNQITDHRIIKVMSDLPREMFLPESKRGFAYVDTCISFGEGRFLMEPLIMARLLQALELKESDVALSIGCGSGYSVAVLSRIVNTVVAVEEDKNLSQSAMKVFAENEMSNIVLVQGTLSDGYPKQAPYDVIFFDGGVDSVSEKIGKQMSEEGRAVAVVIGSRGGHLTLFKKNHGLISSLDLFDANIPFLPGFEPKEKFMF